MGVKTSAMKYDVSENIVYVWHPEPVFLQTREDIAFYFEANRRFWRVTCGGRKAYFVIDFDGQSTKPVRNPGSYPS